MSTYRTNLMMCSPLIVLARTNQPIRPIPPNGITGTTGTTGWTLSWQLFHREIEDFAWPKSCHADWIYKMQFMILYASHFVAMWYHKPCKNHQKQSKTVGIPAAIKNQWPFQLHPKTIKLAWNCHWHLLLALLESQVHVGTPRCWPKTTDRQVALGGGAGKPRAK